MGDFKWLVIGVIAIMAFYAAINIFGESDSMETNQQRRERYAHEVEMAKLQPCVIGLDSTVVIDGVKYKLVKQ